MHECQWPVRSFWQNKNLRSLQVSHLNAHFQFTSSLFNQVTGYSFFPSLKLERMRTIIITMLFLTAIVGPCRSSACTFSIYAVVFHSTRLQVTASSFPVLSLKVWTLITTMLFLTGILSTCRSSACIFSIYGVVVHSTRLQVTASFLGWPRIRRMRDSKVHIPFTLILFKQLSPVTVKDSVTDPCHCGTPMN